jgi:SpoVK/Ycf46/Vps4 family AAA+-type ATPase
MAQDIEAPDFRPVLASSSNFRGAGEDGKMWSVSGENFYPCQKAVDKLEPGQYLVRYSDTQGFYFVRKTVSLDNLIVLPDNNSAKVIDSIENFWTKEQFFRDFGFLWKRGVMLWGPPGSGKTSTVQQISKKIIDMGGISIYSTYPAHDAEGLRMLRKIEPNRPIVVILEDIDSIIKQYGESEILAMLDGELQVDNVVFVATTNYPELLDKRITNRPSRFDEVIYIGMPSDDARREFLRIKNPALLENETELAKWVESTDGFSVAHLKELIVSVECLGNDFNESLARIKRMIDSDPSSSKGDKKGFGFMN